MRFVDAWTAFLVMLFLVVGLCGLFASYATSIPLERAVARSTLLDQALAASTAPDAPARLDALRPALGSLAAPLLDGAGPMPERVAQARLVITDEQRRESVSIGYRTRFMLAVVTVIAAFLAAGILALTRRMAANDAQPTEGEEA